MKKLIPAFALVLLLCGCTFTFNTKTDKNVPDGYTSYKKFLDSERWMDWTDYCYYDYGDSAKVTLSDKYEPLDKAELLQRVKDDAKTFLNWMEAEKRGDEPRFTLEDITSDDFAYVIKDGKTTDIEVVELYWFDTGSNVLHYLYAKW